MTYGVDVYVSGKWKFARGGFATLQAAIDYGADKWGGHFHVWFNGDCVYDSQPGEFGPAASGPGDAPVDDARALVLQRDHEPACACGNTFSAGDSACQYCGAPAPIY